MIIIDIGNDNHYTTAFNEFKSHNYYIKFLSS